MKHRTPYMRKTILQDYAPRQPRKVSPFSALPGIIANIGLMCLCAMGIAIAFVGAFG